MEYRDINYATLSAWFNNVVVEIVISRIPTIVIRLNSTFMRSIVLPVKYVLIYEREKQIISYLTIKEYVNISVKL